VTLLIALLTAVFAYFLVGYLVGAAPQLQLREDDGELSNAQVWLIQAGLDMTPTMFRSWSFLLGVVTFFIGTAITGAFWVAVPPAIAAMFLPKWFYGRRRIKRLGEVQEAWPDGLRHLVASIRSGMSLPMALDELAATGPDGLRQAFARYPTLARVFGLRPALEVIRDELADPTTDRIVEVLLLAHERGGPMVPDILRDLAEATTQDLRTAEEIRTNALEQRLNARIVFVIPWFVLILLTARQGLYREFYQSPAGFLVVAFAAVLSLGGSLLVARLGREEVEERVFGGSARGVQG
jgi:tight adherence protein B